MGQIPLNPVYQHFFNQLLIFDQIEEIFFLNWGIAMDMKPSSFGITSTFASCGGYGLLLMTGLSQAGGIAPAGQNFTAAALFLGFGLITSGLIIAVAGQMRRLMIPEALGLAGAALAGLALGWSLDPSSGAPAKMPFIASILLAFISFAASFMIGQAESFGERRMKQLIVPAYLMFTAASGSVLYVVMAEITKTPSPFYNVFALCALSSVALLKLAIWIESDKRRPWSNDAALKMRGAVELSLITAMIAVFAAISSTGSWAMILTLVSCVCTGIALAVDRWMTQRGAIMALAHTPGAAAQAPAQTMPAAEQSAL